MSKIMIEKQFDRRVAKAKQQPVRHPR